MKSRLSQVLKKEFHAKMSAGRPDFQKVGTAFGGLIYRKQSGAGGHYIFIFLSPDSKYDRFTIELASSTTPDYPFDILPGESISGGAARSRIRSFLERRSDGWWRANESDQLIDIDAYMNLQSKPRMDDALARIPHLVEDAFQQLPSALAKFLATISPSTDS